MAMGKRAWPWRTVAAGALLLVVSAVLVIQLSSLLPQAATWVPPDYEYFIRWGREARAGTLAYRYPLSTLVWVFIPLSLLPTWFAVVWVVAPFVFVLRLFGRHGVILWLSYPMLVHTMQGQIDGWLLLPLYWLVNNHPLLAGVSAALVTLKPQLAIFPVTTMLLRWLWRRQWRPLALFAGTMALLYVPTFMLDPRWPLKMVAEGQVRAGESIQQTRGATLWGWWWHGGWTQWLLPLVLLLVVILAARAFRHDDRRPQVAHLLGLLSVPVLYALSLLTAVVALPNRTRYLVLFTAVSWLGVLLDILFRGWGGAYVVMPIAVLGMLAFEGHRHPMSLRHRMSRSGGEKL